MRILVTGGTGFIGSHAVAALVHAGHDLRLLVRDPAKVERALGPLGVGPVDHVVGDVTDAASVEAAVEDCEATLHTAALVSLSRADGHRMLQTNAAGAANVLGASARRGLDPIVHISSISAVFPPRGAILRADDPVTEPSSVYGRSKAECERFARALQSAGLPVVTVYPGGVIGPDDAGVNELAHSTARLINQGVFPLPSAGGQLFIDVRDLADALARMFTPGRGPRRYMAGGTFVTWDEWAAALADACGRSLRTPRIPAPVYRGIGRVGEAVAGLLRRDALITYEMAYYMTTAVSSDDSAVHDELGVTYRPLIDSTRDLVAWLVRTGHVRADRAPAIVGPGIGVPAAPAS